jgi:hypothetical protein
VQHVKHEFKAKWMWTDQAAAPSRRDPVRRPVPAGEPLPEGARTASTATSRCSCASRSAPPATCRTTRTR